MAEPVTSFFFAASAFLTGRHSIVRTNADFGSGNALSTPASPLEFRLETGQANRVELRGQAASVRRQNPTCWTWCFVESLACGDAGDEDRCSMFNGKADYLCVAVHWPHINPHPPLTQTRAPRTSSMGVTYAEAYPQCMTRQHAHGAGPQKYPKYPSNDVTGVTSSSLHGTSQLILPHADSPHCMATDPTQSAWQWQACLYGVCISTTPVLDKHKT